MFRVRRKVMSHVRDAEEEGIVQAKGCVIFRLLDGPHKYFELLSRVRVLGHEELRDGRHGDIESFTVLLLRPFLDEIAVRRRSVRAQWLSVRLGGVAHRRCIAVAQVKKRHGSDDVHSALIRLERLQREREVYSVDHSFR